MKKKRFIVLVVMGISIIEIVIGLILYYPFLINNMDYLLIIQKDPHPWGETPASPWVLNAGPRLNYELRLCLLSLFLLVTGVGLLNICLDDRKTRRGQKT